MKKLKSKDIAHWAILGFAVLVIGIIGTITLTRSHADTVTPLAVTDCSLRGRVWGKGSCSEQCQSGAGSHMVGTTHNYCSNTITTSTDSATCASWGRKSVINGPADQSGCARNWQQKNGVGAIQCVTSTSKYLVQDTHDLCTQSCIALDDYGFGKVNPDHYQAWNTIDGTQYGACFVTHGDVKIADCIALAYYVHTYQPDGSTKYTLSCDIPAQTI